MGLVSAVAPLAAQAFGAVSPEVRRALRVGLWAAVLGVPLTLGLSGDRSSLRSGSRRVLRARAALSLRARLEPDPGLVFIALRGFMGAVNRPEPALWITLAAIPANALLAYVLIYGAFGLPRLELLGAGLATTLVNIGMCVAAF